MVHKVQHVVFSIAIIIALCIAEIEYVVHYTDSIYFKGTVQILEAYACAYLREVEITHLAPPTAVGRR